MKIKNILISQPAPATLERSPFQEIAAKYNVSLDFHPFIKVERVSVKEFRSQRVDILDHTAVIFTNRSSVDHFFQICEETRVSIPETMKYFCVTEAIALYLQKYIVYRKRKIFFGKATFADLIDQIMKHSGEKFFLPLPDPHKPEIPETLDKLKVKYTKVIMSRTVSADVSSVNLDNYDIVVFYSPIEISTLKSVKPETKCNLKIATFGNGTAVAAVDSGYKVSVIAPTPDCPSMVNALDKFIKKYNAGEKIEDVVIEKKSMDIPQLKTDSKSVKKAKPKPKTVAAAASDKESVIKEKKCPAKSKSA